MFQQLPAAASDISIEIPAAESDPIVTDEPAAGSESIVTDKPLPFGVYRGDLRQPAPAVAES